MLISAVFTMKYNDLKYHLILHVLLIFMVECSFFPHYSNKALISRSTVSYGQSHLKTNSWASLCISHFTWKLSPYFVSAVSHFLLLSFLSEYCSFLLSSSLFLCYSLANMRTLTFGVLYPLLKCGTATTVVLSVFCSDVKGSLILLLVLIMSMMECCVRLWSWCTMGVLVLIAWLPCKTKSSLQGIIT